MKTDNIPGLVGYHITGGGTLYSRFDKSGHLTHHIGYPRNSNRTTNNYQLPELKNIAK